MKPQMSTMPASKSAPMDKRHICRSPSCRNDSSGGSKRSFVNSLGWWKLRVTLRELWPQYQIDSQACRVPRSSPAAFVDLHLDHVAAVRKGALAAVEGAALEQARPIAFGKVSRD